ncbi:EamA family transporter [Rhodococcus sp. MSC1_016]|jgi:inner membrane transporter RhtA|uniref:EamA family transporter n=1 Tax=Rhodococcus sp. MSC1_016 TaxID=2909266 RepID=UPI002030E458|nr:EamA family transporter [Rhodococcus sp. MSC1_016]
MLSSETSSKARALGAVVLSGTSFQVGAAFGALLFPAVGATGVVALRMLIAAPTLLLIGRPRFARFTRPEFLIIGCLGTAMATMSLALFAAVDRVGLGVAVTIEFLGPLTVSLLSSKRIVDAVCAVGAAAAVVLLTGFSGNSDPLGLVLAFLAAAMWGSSIVLNARLSVALPGTQGTAAAMAVAALWCIPIGAVSAGSALLDWKILLIGVGAAVLASVIPPLLELFAIRRLTRATYGTVMALYPAIAALAGLIVLGERLGGTQWVAVALICTSSAAATLSAANSPHHNTNHPRGADTVRGEPTSDGTHPHPPIMCKDPATRCTACVCASEAAKPTVNTVSAASRPTDRSEKEYADG